MVTEIAAIAAFAVLFMVFGMLRLRAGCEDCSCADGVCERREGSGGSAAEQ